jgi:hypothetical protein
MAINNRDMAAYVRNTKPFTNNNKTVWTNWEGKFYVVYSYGRHFPMYAYDTEAAIWYGNESKFSRTTTTHQRKAQPVPNEEITWVDTEKFHYILEARSTSGYIASLLTN